MFFDKILLNLLNAFPEILKNGKSIKNGAAISVFRAVDIMLEMAILAIDVNGAFVGTDRLRDLAGEKAETIVNLLNKNREAYKDYRSSP